MKIKFLDGLRGIAAVYVMLGHARWLLWEGNAEGYQLHPNAYSVVDKVLMYFLSVFKFGHETVLFFFVLSGFVIHIGYASKLSKDPTGKIDFVRYFKNRIKRIYPPFIFALLLTTTLDFIGIASQFSIYFGQSPKDSVNLNVGNPAYGTLPFIGNLLFLYKEYVPLYGTNGPAWSLKLEWWFYLLYPLFLLLSRRNIFMSTGLIVALFGLSLATDRWAEPLLQNVFSFMLCWWLGVMLAEITVGRIKVHLLFVAFLAFVAFAALALSETVVLYELQMAFFHFAILAALLWYHFKGKSLAWLDALKTVGDFSYTLYIIHFPILVLLFGLLLKYNQNRFPMHSYFVLIGASICVGVAYLAHYVVEVPFVKKKISLTTAKAIDHSVVSK